MQKLFVFVVLSLIALSCGQVEKQREAITSLATEWDSTTQMVAAFTSELKLETANWQRMYDDMFSRVTVSENVSDEAQAEAEQLKQAWQAHGAAFQGLQAEVDGFIKSWEEKTAEVTALKEGLETGQLPAELTEKMAALRESLSTVPATLETWRNTLQETKDQSQSTFQRQTELTKEQDS